jgi:hypothetical protein
MALGKLSVEGPPYIRKYHDSSIVSNKVLDYYSVMEENAYDNIF